MSIRIHDYAHIEDAEVARAQEVVSGMYRAIGVRTDWLESLEQAAIPPEAEAAPQAEGASQGDGEADCEPSDLVVIILTSAMANRGLIPDAIVGFAAVARGGGGRVAYVIYDRVRDIARNTAIDDMRMMGIVMAHEIGHLLLTNHSHSEGGLMRGRWDQFEFGSVRPADLEFSSPEATAIRRTLRVGLAQ